MATATAISTTTKVINISLPEALLQEIDAQAAEEHRSRSEFLREAARARISDARWRRVQAEGAIRAREAGLRTEDDVEEFLDSIVD